MGNTRLTDVAVSRVSAVAHPKSHVATCSWSSSPSPSLIECRVKMSLGLDPCCLRAPLRCSGFNQSRAAHAQTQRRTETNAGQLSSLAWSPMYKCTKASWRVTMAFGCVHPVGGVMGFGIFGPVDITHTHKIITPGDPKPITRHYLLSYMPISQAVS